MTENALTIPGRFCDRLISTTLEACGRPAAVRVIGGCVHEHITTGHLCGEHHAEARDGRTLCRSCYLGPDAHRCLLLVREVVGDAH